jgi:hypothetical protein
MAWSPLTITKGATTIEVDILTESAQELPSAKVGSAGRVMGGRIRSSISNEFREWQFTHAIMLADDFETLRNMVKNGAFVTVAGRLVKSVGGFLATVELGASDYVEDTSVADGFKQRVVMTIKTAA